MRERKLPRHVVARSRGAASATVPTHKLRVKTGRLRLSSIGGAGFGRRVSV